MNAVNISLTVNGHLVEETVTPETLLAAFLRERLTLTGTHIGCDTTQCGCCTVLVDGDAIKSCTLLAVQADGRRVTTLEGLAGEDGSMHPVKEAFHRHHGLQCGFCTPGFVMSVVELVEKYQDLSEAKIRELIEGNICRCTGYHNIVQAVLSAAQTMKGSAARTVRGKG